MNNSTLTPLPFGIDQTLVLLMVTAIAEIIAAYYLYKMSHTEEDTYGLARKSFLGKKPASTVTSFVNKSTRNG